MCEREEARKVEVAAASIHRRRRRRRCLLPRTCSSSGFFWKSPPPNLCVGGGFKRKKEDEEGREGGGEKRGVYTGFTVRTVESSLLLNSLTKKKCLPVVGGHAERKREGEEEIRGRGGGFLNCVTVTLPLRPRKRSRMSVCGSNAQFLGGRGRPTDFSSSSCPIDRPT